MVVESIKIRLTGSWFASEPLNDHILIWFSNFFSCEDSNVRWESFEKLKMLPAWIWANMWAAFDFDPVYLFCFEVAK